MMVQRSFSSLLRVAIVVVLLASGSAAGAADKLRTGDKVEVKIRDEWEPGRVHKVVDEDYVIIIRSKSGRTHMAHVDELRPRESSNTPTAKSSSTESSSQKSAAGGSSSSRSSSSQSYSSESSPDGSSTSESFSRRSTRRSSSSRSSVRKGPGAVSAKSKSGVAGDSSPPVSPNEVNPFLSEQEQTARLAMRTWSDKSGRFSIEANLVRVDGDTVVLRRDSGKEVKVPLAKLSDADGNVARGKLPGGSGRGQQGDTAEIVKTDLMSADVFDRSPPSQWTYTPDPAPPLEHPVSEHNVEITLAKGADHFDDLACLLVDRRRQRAYAIGTGSPFGDNKYNATVFACNLATGGLDGTGVFVPGQMPVSLAPDGDRILAHSNGERFGNNTVASIYSLTSGDAEPLLRWEPYSGKGFGGKADDIDWMEFSDDDHVLTFGGRTQLVYWQLSPLRAVWVAEGGGHAKPVFSHGRKVVALPTGQVGDDGLMLLEVATGKKLGYFASELSSFSRWAFSPSGEKIANFEDGRCLVWNLNPLELVRDFSLSHEIDLPHPEHRNSEHFAWVDEQRLLVMGRYLIDTERRIWLWEYPSMEGLLNVAGNHVCCASTAHRKWTLTSTVMPNQEALDMAASLTTEDLLVVKPGMAVSIELDINSPAGERQEIETELARRLEEKGFTVDPNSNIKLYAEHRIGETQQVDFKNWRDLGASGEVHDVTPQYLELAFIVADRKVWNRLYTYSGTNIRLQEGETLEQAIVRQTTADPKDLLRFKIPSHVAGGKLNEPYGRSELVGMNPSGGKTTTRPR